MPLLELMVSNQIRIVNINFSNGKDFNPNIMLLKVYKVVYEKLKKTYPTG